MNGVQVVVGSNPITPTISFLRSTIIIFFAVYLFYKPVIQRMSLSPQTWPSAVYIVIPSYKSADRLERFLPSLLTVAPPTHVCVVDDASEDGTGEICKRFDVACIPHAVNQGKGAALKTGFARAIERRMAWVITMDADGQHAVGDLEHFIDESCRRPSPGLIIGARSMLPGHMPLARIISNTLTSAILSMLTRQKIIDSQCGFRMYSARLISALPVTHNRFEMESEIILRACHAGFPVSFIRVQTLYCSDRSHISHFYDTIRWVKAVVSISRELRRTGPHAVERKTP